MPTSKEILPIKVTRRQAVHYGIIFLGALIGAACAPQPTIPAAPDRRNPTPIAPAVKAATAPVTLTPESLDPQIIEKARRDVFNLNNYTKSVREKMVGFWLQGAPGLVEITKDNQPYLLSFQPAKPDSEIKDLARTGVSLLRPNLSTGGTALVFYLAGSYNPRLGDTMPKQIKQDLEAMNFEHEGLISLAYVNGLVSVGTDLGLDFKSPSQAKPEEANQISRLKSYMPTIRAYAEAIAEVNDYIRTFPLFNKNPEGNILFVEVPGNQKPLPVINDRVFLEEGLTFIVDQTVGPSFKGIADLDQLAQIYPSLGTIPGSAEYLKQIQEHYQNHP